MNPNRLQLGFSPCPNDTFLFDALVHGKVDTEGLQFDYHTEDVETLNQWAEEGRLDLTKISFHALLGQGHQYGLLKAGSALGRGVGPLLITRNPCRPQQVSGQLIAIPGKLTTAHMLLRLAFPAAEQKTAMPFHQIEDALVEGKVPLGLIIHENRFTYKQKGLQAVMDLGQWWEEKTGLPIPLGGIALHRRHPRSLAEKLDRVLRRSLDWAWAQYPQLSPFVTDLAQAMDPTVMRQHIELYVNDFSRDLGEEGHKAIETLFEWARERKWIPEGAASPFF